MHGFPFWTCLETLDPSLLTPAAIAITSYFNIILIYIYNEIIILYIQGIPVQESKRVVPFRYTTGLLKSVRIYNNNMLFEKNN